MNATSIVSVSAAIVAVVLFAVAYGKYRTAAKLAETWKTLAGLKETYANELNKLLAEKEAALRKSEAARLAKMPASDIADLFSGMYGPKAGSGKSGR